MDDDFFGSFFGPKEDEKHKIRRWFHKRHRSRLAVRTIFIPSDGLKIGFFSLLYLVILFFLSYSNYMGPEDWWWSCLNAYLPQWAWAAPGLILLPIALWKARRVAFMSVLGMLWVFGPLMGLCWNFHPPHASNYPGGIPIRILTYNVNHHSDSEGVLEEIERNHPDIILLQEANERVDGAYISSLRNWHLVFHRDGCLAITRYPILQSEWRDIPGFSGRGQYIRMELLVHHEKIVVYDVHLDTPRISLADLRTHFLTNIPEFQSDIQNRILKAMTLDASLLREREPMIVAGDFNSPPQSLICRILEHGRLQDSFSLVGRGYGYTYGYTLRPYIPYIRIDHILTDRRVHPIRCWVGSGRASDHRALIADLVIDPPS